MKCVIFIAFILLLASAKPVASQPDNLLRCKTIIPGSTTVFIDTLVFDPATITIYPPRPYTYSDTSSSITLNEPAKDTLLMCYRILPWQKGQLFYNRDKEEHFENISQYQQSRQKKEASKNALTPETIINTGEIDKMGAISRSVSFGNSQNVFVNSTLNLQLEGKLTNDLNLQAVITDRNIPFQPEGNTQQIRDFDNVFIRLYNDNVDLTAGDVVLQHQEGYFLRYYKNVQGGVIKYKKESDAMKSITSAAISVAKGQFASVQLASIEGVQGPYRIRGPNNERFVIVMANSERIFLDGKQLQRGFDRDYIIDYNLAEITFNPGVLITKFSRIRVDFEYADQNYSRSILGVGHELEASKFAFRTHFYRERDNKNQPLAYTLSDADKLQLSLLPSNERIGNISGADSVGFSQDRILYARVDTITAGQQYNIYRYSTDPNTAVFAVTFSEVGENQGNYRPTNSTLNGRVYEWVAPLGGMMQGSHEPIVSVPTPNQKQLWVNAVEYKINDHHKLFTELAISNMVDNLYSSDNGAATIGLGSKSGYRIEALPVGSKGYKLSTELSYEHNSASFNAIDRFRYIEFDRDWSYIKQDSMPQLTENITVAQAGVKKDANNYLDYRLSLRQRGGSVFSGVQQQAAMGKQIGRLQNLSEVYLMKSGQADIASEWMRLLTDTYYESGVLVPGYRYQVDRNSVYFTENDSIFSTAMNFSEHQWYIRTNDTLKNKLRLDMSIREDMLPVDGELLPQNRAFTMSLKGATPMARLQRLQYNFTFRRMKDLLDSTQPDELTTMGRLDWSGSFLKKTLKSELTYAIANSRELRREFVFIQVSNGLGTHTWRDDNGDGIQDLTEFYLAINPDERNYVKIFTPTDDYLLAFNNLLNYRLQVDLPRSWQNTGGLKSLLARVSNITSLALDSKTTSDDLSARYNPFVGGIEDNDILSRKGNVRSSFFVNRGNPKYGLEAVYSAITAKQLLTNGIESRGQHGWGLNARYNIKREVTTNLRYDFGNRTNSSDVLQNRNYAIIYTNLAPQLVWQPTNQFRMLGQYGHKIKTNTLADGAGENSTINEYLVEARWSKAIERSISANLRLLDIAFEGVENSPIGYELLEALRPGRNFTWNLQWQQKLINGLQIAVGYEGRSSPAQQLVHIGRMQVTALF